MSNSGNASPPHVLLVNPWIHDFAAYDFWAKPYGLLSLAAVLRRYGARISYIDCLDRFHPKAPAGDPLARHGRGPYLKRPIPHPKGLEDIERTYSRYGIPPDWFRQDLRMLDRPDLILVTSLMTYWYPGVFETIAELKSVFSNVPVVLGGVYARLYPDHARRLSGADAIVTDRGESLAEIVREFTGWALPARLDFNEMDTWPLPAFDLQHCINYVPLLTGRGCPYGCAYCAASLLEPQFKRRSPSSVVAEIIHWHRHHGVKDFAFYDDALLVNAADHALPIFEGVIQAGLPLSFHTPNAIHIRAVTARLAETMKQAGFHTLRLGLETASREERSGLDEKVASDEFTRAIGYLLAAGFNADQVGAYLLVGLPGQTFTSVEASIVAVKRAGIRPVLAYYTPIPHTELWPRAMAASRYDLAADPIFCNNAIFPCRSEKFSWPALSRLKALIQS